MNASLLTASHTRCQHLRVRLVIEPATYAGLARLVAEPNLISTQNEKYLRRKVFFIWLRGLDSNQRP